MAQKLIMVIDDVGSGPLTVYEAVAARQCLLEREAADAGRHVQLAARSGVVPEALHRFRTQAVCTTSPAPGLPGAGT